MGASRASAVAEGVGGCLLLQGVGSYFDLRLDTGFFFWLAMIALALADLLRFVSKRENVR